MGAQLVQTRGGCMLIVRPRKRRFRKSRRTARHKARNVPPCKHWDSEAAQLYRDQFQHLKAGVIPEGSVRNVPTASQGTEVLLPSRENGTAAPAQTKESYIAWFDGACEPVNPGGTASFGVVVKDDAGTVLLKEHGLVGRGEAMSNNVAEYAGVLHILKYLASRPPGRVTIYGDSNLAINQLSGRWRIKKGLYVSIAIETKELLAYLRRLGWQIGFRWIPRDQNEECDALSKKIGNTPDSVERFDRQDNQDRQDHCAQEGFLQGCQMVSEAETVRSAQRGTAVRKLPLALTTHVLRTTLSVISKPLCLTNGMPVVERSTFP